MREAKAQERRTQNPPKKERKARKRRYALKPDKQSKRIASRRGREGGSFLLPHGWPRRKDNNKVQQQRGALFAFVFLSVFLRCVCACGCGWNCIDVATGSPTLQRRCQLHSLVCMCMCVCVTSLPFNERLSSVFFRVTSLVA